MKWIKHSNLILAGGIFILLLLAYSNHFDNGFYFDDTHTIVNNNFIRDINLLPHYFTDIKYYGTMQGNQGYNPVLVSLNAIDYWMAGGLDPVIFHLSIFFWYVMLLLLLYFFVHHLFKDSMQGGSSNLSIAAILTVGFYGLHASNAETINYIIMRSDSFSTFLILASFTLYIWPFGKKYYLYLITLLLAVLTKETGVMFGPLLLVYILLFEERISVPAMFQKNHLAALGRTFLKALPANLLAFGSFYFIRSHFIPKSHQVFGGGEFNSVSVLDYFSTQWYVICHYLANFVLPLDLSADPDFQIIKNLLDQRILLSLALLLILLGIAIHASTKRNLRPIAFGIFWFFIALAPTSSLHPLGQISNDHRTFFPYIGLCISLGWTALLLWKKYSNRFEPKTSKAVFTSILGIIFCLHAYGTYQRNEVWNSAEELWLDVTIKSPNNARGLMNYGITQMSEARYEVAAKYFEKALALEPNYSYLHINLGILNNAMGNTATAENFFKNAIRLAPGNAEAYLYYGNWLFDQKRLEDAERIINQGINVSPGHLKLQNMMARIKQVDQADPQAMVNELQQISKTNPTEANYINLSIELYKQKMYEACIGACMEALKINPQSADAYNNICSAYIKLGKPQEAIKACEKALEIRPGFNLARNNLNWAKESL